MIIYLCWAYNYFLRSLQINNKRKYPKNPAIKVTPKRMPMSFQNPQVKTPKATPVKI